MRKDICDALFQLECGVILWSLSGTSGRPVQGYESKEYARGRVLITSSVADAESLSTCEVFQLMLQAGDVFAWMMKQNPLIPKYGLLIESKQHPLNPWNNMNEIISKYGWKIARGKSDIYGRIHVKIRSRYFFPWMGPLKCTPKLSPQSRDFWHFFPAVSGTSSSWVCGGAREPANGKLETLGLLSSASSWQIYQDGMMGCDQSFFWLLEGCFL